MSITASEMGKIGRANFFKGMSEDEKKAYLQRIARLPRRKRVKQGKRSLTPLQ